MEKAKKGDWVRIYNVVLEPENRAPQVPDDTKKVPLEMWVKGFLLNDEAKKGEEVEVETYIGRKVKGELIEINPYYDHDFGKCVPELLYIGRQLRGILEDGEYDE
ncbi:2-amino-4-oxopentanoate thiolase subunit OrtA [Caldisalinibacter kiritimatiensis]|uniref:2-amino-4-ketopentanoate thiolase, alpha subunit n=1 Tax=Caldisalinibacter kiritimatiensis TaxID=1304284 RepID=R1CXQ1_9FIRM|nr:2-amino-4-oxopentanoate thiolase subunit OrtA [Caldisalinibacter kiritimatiensis]EOD01384.1 2-amino-4-ketopentanoate thiolase, alpha subunit [Caldisalinibacter kiritimatiensis]